MEHSITRQYLSETYQELIGYYPYEDDPTITDAEVRQTLIEYRREPETDLVCEPFKSDGVDYFFDNGTEPAENVHHFGKEFNTPEQLNNKCFDLEDAHNQEIAY